MTESPKACGYDACKGCLTCQPSQAAILKLCRYTHEPITEPVRHCAICEACNLYPCADAVKVIDRQVDQIDWVNEERKSHHLKSSGVV